MGQETFKAFLKKMMSKSLFNSYISALTAARSLLLGKEISFEHPYSWLSVFEEDDLQEFINELNEAFRLINSSNMAWDMIKALIHEWHESAIAYSSTELAAAFSGETDEVPLTLPTVGSGI